MFPVAAVRVLKEGSGIRFLCSSGGSGAHGAGYCELGHSRQALRRFCDEVLEANSVQF